MKHKHHIIPKHAGGTNDPSNLIELTTKEHAEAHKILWEKYGRWQDYYAWQGLSGQIGKEDLIKEIQSIANRGTKSEETKAKMSKAFTGRKYSKQFCENASKVMKKRWEQGKYDAEKLRLSRIGFKQPESQKIAVSKALSKKYLITDPKGNKFEIINLRRFCMENNLDQGNMSRGKHKGWKCVKIGT